MSRYALLILPSANRVYSEAATRLVRAELEVFNQAVLDGRIGSVEAESMGGVPYLGFECDALGEREVDLLSNLSSLYALFEREGDLLRPVPIHRLDRFGDELITIQKYPGKTNEQFTKLLLNVTLMSSRFAPQMLSRRFRVMDGLCGRGTTLNQAIMYGYDAFGMDLDERDVEAYAIFLQRWAKDSRLKHNCEWGQVRRDRRVVARRLHMTLSADKDDFKAGNVQQVEVVNADTTRMLEFFRPGSMDLIVTDAPYGIQHGSHTSGRGLARSPLELLAAAAPTWAATLRPGGALGISWNSRVARRADAVAVLESCGLDVLPVGEGGEFEHRVDQSILRDVLVARRP
jgi:SAM-dependent methyltransferase